MAFKTGPFRFLPGQLVATPGAIEAFTASGERPFSFLMRHLQVDWGEVDAHDRAENEFAVDKYLRILSAYSLNTGVRFWVITEADRSGTTFLLPDEY